MKVNEKDIKQLTYEGKGQTAFEFNRDDGHLKIVKPEPIDTDDASVRDFVDELNRVRVSSFPQMGNW